MELFRVCRTLQGVETTEDAVDWTLATAGDAEAFGRLFDRHRDRVFRHAFALARNAMDADDIVAVAFLEAWRRRDRVRLVDGSLLPWLLVTATNAASNVRRSQRRYRALLAKLPPGEVVPDPADRFAEDAARTALKSLSARDQEVLALCVIGDLSERDAAAALGVPIGTVKSRLARARARLAERVRSDSARTLLKEEGTYGI